MLSSFGLNTNSFYKFTTTLTLIASVYFLSFADLFLAPHNKYMSEVNVEKAKLTAEIGYLSGVSKDLLTGLPDSVTKYYIQYFYFSKKSGSDTMFYYKANELSLALKARVDSLNMTNKKLGESKFKAKSLSDTQKALDKNMRIKKIISTVLGVAMLLLFFLSLWKWYRLKEVLDK